MGRIVTKPVFQVSPKNEAQTSLLSYKDKIDNWNFACYKSRYDTLQKANNKGADQTGLMHRLACAFVVRKTPKTGFLASRLIFPTIGGSQTVLPSIRDVQTMLRDSCMCLIITFPIFQSVYFIMLIELLTCMYNESEVQIM